MNDYSKDVKIKFSVDKDSLNKVKEAMNSVDALGDKKELQQYMQSLKDFSKDKAIPKEFRDNFKKELRELKRDIVKDKVEDFGEGFKEQMFPGNAKGEGVDWKQAGQNFASEIGTVLSKAKDALVNVLKDAWSELDDILKYSLLSNQNTRDLAFTYGFSGSQAYGYNKAMGIMGLQSEEDLMYLNPQQREQFFKMMTNFTEKYDSLYDQGFFDEYLNYQYEMAEFKEDMKLEVVQFFMDNKDLIKAGMKAIMTLATGALKALDSIVSLLRGGRRDESDRIAASTDIINSYSNNSRKTDVKIDNTFNNVAKQDQGWLVNAGMTVSEQIVRAFD